jgi:hypothetical protein
MLLAQSGAIPLGVLEYGPGFVLYFRFRRGSEIMTQGTVQLVAGILAVVLIAIVILRRKGKKKDEDEF